MRSKFVQNPRPGLFELLDGERSHQLRF
jgi:hypothetical protein